VPFDAQEGFEEIREMRPCLLAFAAVLVLALPGSGLGSAAGDLVLDSKIESMKKAGVGPVVYPHALHEKLYKCADCHPRIFKEKRGATEMSMKLNMEGRICGSPNCHNSQKAFPLYNCAKCHTEIGAK